MINKKISSNKAKHLLVEKELKTLQTFDSSLLIGKNYFNNDEEKLFLILQLQYYTLKRLDDTEKVISWKCKDSPDKKLTNPTNTDNSFSPSNQMVRKVKLLFNISRNLIKTKIATFNPPNIIISLLLMN